MKPIHPAKLRIGDAIIEGKSDIAHDLSAANLGVGEMVFTFAQLQVNSEAEARKKIPANTGMVFIFEGTRSTRAILPEESIREQIKAKAVVHSTCTDETTKIFKITNLELTEKIL